jgi:hypothetical protein
VHGGALLPWPPPACPQESFALKVLAAAKPTAVVLVNGGALAIDALVDPAPAILEVRLKRIHSLIHSLTEPFQKKTRFGQPSHTLPRLWSPSSQINIPVSHPLCIVLHLSIRVHQAYYPGVLGAQVVAAALFGDTNRFGRLPYTVYPANFTAQVDMNNMSMQAGPGRTYKYYTGVCDREGGGNEDSLARPRVNLSSCARRRWCRPGTQVGGGVKCVWRRGGGGHRGRSLPTPASPFSPLPPCTGTPLFAFGQGLSYTTFSVACTNVTGNASVTVSCGVTNTGSRAGDNVLLVFHRVGTDISGHVNHPVPQVRGGHAAVGNAWCICVGGWAVGSRSECF